MIEKMSLHILFLRHGSCGAGEGFVCKCTQKSRCLQLLAVAFYMNRMPFGGFLGRVNKKVGLINPFLIAGLRLWGFFCRKKIFWDDVKLVI